MSPERAMIFVDGENLTLRFQAMKAAGRQASEAVKHSDDVYVWHQNVSDLRRWNLVRTSYYTSVVGDDPRIAGVSKEIAAIQTRANHVEGRVTPYVFKKPSRSIKTRSVDIAITIDMMRYAFASEIDTLVLLSGDGDFIPLIQDIMRRGKRVIVGAFSDGLCERLQYVSDHFVLLDDTFLYGSSQPVAPPNAGS